MSVTNANDGALWLVTKSGKNGDQITKVEAEESLSREKAAAFLKAEAKNETTARRAWQTILAEILGNPIVGTWRGKGDPKLSTLAKEFKASMRDAEGAYVRALFSDGVLKSRTPESQESEIQAMCGRLREDKNYSNIKNLVSRYFFCLGKPCKVGEFLVPAPAMMQELADAKEKVEHDTSVAGQLRDILAIVKGDGQSVTLKADAVNSALSVAHEILTQLVGMRDYYAALATAQAEQLPPNVADVAAPKGNGQFKRAPKPVQEMEQAPM